MSQRRAQLIGIGMIGGSIAAALRARDWHVTGDDVDGDRLRGAQKAGVIDAIGIDDKAEVTFIATPVSFVVERAQAALERGSIVTDAGSVKGSIVGAISHPQFVGGHPMAGSERSGLEGVNPNLFEGATWVLTPSDHTDAESYMTIRTIVGELGASVVTLPAVEHDEIVATVSHVPHIAASALMNVAMQGAYKHEILLRLAASGFRDMTRIAAGHPHLWSDIAMQNRDEIVDGLGKLIAELDSVREQLAAGKQSNVEEWLTEASTARKELPLRTGRPSALSLMRVPIPDRPGALGQVLGVFGTLRANVEDLEIAHDPSGERGVLNITVGTEAVGRVRHALVDLGFAVAVEGL